MIKFKGRTRGAWMTQSVEHLILGFGSGHDLVVCEAHTGLCADRVEAA